MEKWNQLNALLRPQKAVPYPFFEPAFPTSGNGSSLSGNSTLTLFPWIQYAAFIGTV